VTDRTPIRRRVPVTDYLRLQKRFAHLFAPTEDAASIALIQEAADRNIAEFGLASQGT
jgi:pyruvate ferredoxin oxidoreductase beta subunit